MLLEFTVKNYKTFTNETTFSMECAPKQSGLDYSVFNEKNAGKAVKVLCSSVIYGPNAAGKTNLIGAMDTFRSIVLRGNIRNSNESISPNVAAYNLEYIPNRGVQNQPVKFSVTFMEKDYSIKYTLEIDIGNFMDYDYERKVLLEELSVNGILAFRRDKNILDTGEMAKLAKLIKVNASRMFISYATATLKDDELFLTNGFKILVSQDLTQLIVDWFKDKFMVIYRANSVELIRRFSDPKKGTLYVENTITEAAKVFGVDSNALGYKVSDDGSDAKLFSIIQNCNNKTINVAADSYESYGTVRFVNIFPLIIKAIYTGSTLVIDEFDASIHPMALMNIINIFHNDEINTKHAQLIFNTHNPIFLNSNLFRRDEIKFVERNEEDKSTVVYALSDFGTTGKYGVRKDGDYLSNYFVNRYGAIKDVDFTPVFENINKIIDKTEQ